MSLTLTICFTRSCWPENTLKAHRQISEKRCFEKYCSCDKALGYTLTELLKKPDNWRQIYKQTCSTFYTSNTCLKRVEKKKLLGRHNKEIYLRNGCLITFKKMEKQPTLVFYRKAVVKNLAIFTEKHLCWGLLFNSEYCEIFNSTCFQKHLRTAASENVLMKLRKN